MGSNPTTATIFQKMNTEHPEEVINHCIDNRLSFSQAYQELIEEKLTRLEKELSDLKSEVLLAKRKAERKLID